MLTAAIPLLLLLATGVAASAAAEPYNEHVFDTYHDPNDYVHKQTTTTDAETDAARVKVSLYVMSRCPDARLCENVFEEVIKHENIIDKIDLHVDYLGEIDHSAPYGVECMHGDLECAGNAHQLCVHAHAPLDKFYATLTCMNFGNFPGAIGTTALTRRCADTAGIDWWRSGVGRCIEGKRAERAGRAAERYARLTGTDVELPPVPGVEDIDPWAEADELDHLAHEGRRRLRESVKRTKEEGVSKSCTIRIESTIKHSPRECIVDGGVWKSCDDGHAASDFVRVITKEWENLQKN